jgi:hypothetical protein
MLTEPTFDSCSSFAGKTRHGSALLLDSFKRGQRRKGEQPFPLLIFKALNPFM